MPYRTPGIRPLDGATGAINPAAYADYPAPGPSPAPPQRPGGLRIAPQPTGGPASMPGAGPAFAAMLAQRQANGGGSVPIRVAGAPPPDVCFPDGACIPYAYAVALGLVPR